MKYVTMIHIRHNGEVEWDAVREDCRGHSKCWGEGVRPPSKGEVRDVIKNTGNNPGCGHHCRGGADSVSCGVCAL